MTPLQVDSAKRRDYYWSPFPRVFRWPVGIVGVALLAMSLPRLVNGHLWSGTSVVMAVSLLYLAFGEPELRRKTKTDRVAASLLYILFVAVFLLLAWGFYSLLSV